MALSTNSNGSNVLTVAIVYFKYFCRVKKADYIEAKRYRQLDNIIGGMRDIINFIISGTSK